MNLIVSVQQWLNQNGYATPEGVTVSVTSYPDGWCRIRLAGSEMKCVRCANRGPGITARIMGRCSACDTARRSAYARVEMLERDLVPLMRESFTFPKGRELGERYTIIRDGVHNNGAVVTIFVKEKRDE